MLEEWITGRRFDCILETKVIDYSYLKGAQILSNQVSVVVHDLEQKRVDYFKTTEKLKREQETGNRGFKGFIINELLIN